MASHSLRVFVKQLESSAGVPLQKPAAAAAKTLGLDLDAPVSGAAATAVAPKSAPVVPVAKVPSAADLAALQTRMATLEHVVNCLVAGTTAK